MQPIQNSCSTCGDGPCITPLVCQQPLQELQPIRRRLFTSAGSRERLGRIVGAALGTAGGLYVAWHVGVAVGLW